MTRRLLVAFALAAGCGGASGAADDAPIGRDVPPPLGNPPPIDSSAPGATYMTAVAKVIAPGWTAFLEDCRLRLPRAHALNDASLSAMVEIEIERDGRVAAVRVPGGSGVAEFDRAALEVAREAGRMPPPPAELVSDDDRVHLRWLFARDARQAGPASASVRRVELPVDQVVARLVARGRLGDAARRVAEKPIGNNLAFYELLTAVLHEDLAGTSSGQSAAVDAIVSAKIVHLKQDLRRLARSALEPSVRRAALMGLGVLGDRDAVDLLRGVLRGDGGAEAEDSGAAAAALDTLGLRAEVEQAAHVELVAPEEPRRWRALVVMAHVPVDAAVPALAAMLARGSRAARGERMAAAFALGTAAGGGGTNRVVAAKALLGCTGVADAAERGACMQALASAAERGGVPRSALAKIEARLRDPDEGVRGAAVLAVARVDAERLARKLGSFGREKSPAVRAALAEALATVPGPAALAWLTAAVEAEDAAVRAKAATALAARPDGAEVLQRHVEHVDAAVRVAALRVEKRPDVLRGALGADAREVRVAALASLVVAIGAAETIADAARLIAAAPAGTGERAALAAAWLSR